MTNDPTLHDATTWRFWRDDPGFSQRFVGTFVVGGDTQRLAGDAPTGV